MERYRSFPCFVFALFLLSLPALAQGNRSAREGSPGAVTAHRPTIGLVLEGGGALGLAHVGVLRWFEENHIPVDYIAGTSMGGLVGGLYATGMSGEEIDTFLE